MKKKENVNDEIVIRSLSDAEAVRTRPGIYVGAVDNPDLIFREVIDGSLDESYATGCDSILISTNFNDYYFCCDNGRGIPCTMSVDDPNKTQALLAMSKLHAGSKFETTGIRAGMHGCGESATNFLSSRFVLMSKITEQNFDKSIPEVKTLWDSCGPRSKKDLFYIIAFEKGNLVYEGAMKKSDAEKFFFAKEYPGGYMELPSGYSTIVFFRPDPEIFATTKATVPTSNIQNFLLIQEKFYGRKVCVNIDGVDYTSSSFKPYKYEFIRTVIPEDTSLNDQVSVYVTFECDGGLGNKIESGSVNGLTVNQGIHINWLENIFENALRTEYKIKHKCIFQGLKIHVLLLAGEVLYDSQTKTRLRSISKVKSSDLSDIQKDFIKIFRKYPEEWETHVNKLNMLAESMKSISAIDKAQRIIDDSTGRSLYKAKGEMVNLIDATAGPSERWNAELFIVEGQSVKGQMCNSRPSTKYHGILNLRGKVLNVKDSSVDQMMDNKEFFTIFKVIGLGIDVNNVTKDAKSFDEAMELIKKYSRFGKVIIATDADCDGLAIQNGIVYAFLKFARFIIEAGLLYVCESPIFEQDGKYYYPSDPDLTGTPFKVGMNPSKKSRRFKGIGSLSEGKEVYDAFYNPATRRLYRVTLEGCDVAMKLVEDITERKQLLYNNKILTNPYNFTDI